MVNRIGFVLFSILNKIAIWPGSFISICNIGTVIWPLTVTD